MFFYLSSGLILGLSAGVAPGPLLTLVVSQTLTYGAKEGIKVALAPLITDLPIVLFAFFIGSQLTSSPLPLGILSLVGAGYLCFLAWESLTVKTERQNAPRIAAKSIQKGILTNFLNPHPYLFWVTLGMPLVVKTWASSPWGAILWLLSFYVMLVGSKIALSVIVGHSKKRLDGKGYLWLNRALGLLLLFFAFLLIKDGIAMMG